MPICRTRSGGARVKRTDASATILVIQACSSGKSTLPGQSILPVSDSAIVLSRSSRERLSSGSGLAHTPSTIDFCEVSDALDGSLASNPAVKIVAPDDFPPALTGSVAEAPLQKLGQVRVFTERGADQEQTLIERIGEQLHEPWKLEERAARRDDLPRTRQGAIDDLPEARRAVCDALHRTTSSGAPVTTTSPPACPPSGPKSMT